MQNDQEIERIDTILEKGRLSEIKNMVKVIMYKYFEYRGMYRVLLTFIVDKIPLVSLRFGIKEQESLKYLKKQYKKYLKRRMKRLIEKNDIKSLIREIMRNPKFRMTKLLKKSKSWLFLSQALFAVYIVSGSTEFVDKYGLRFRPDFYSMGVNPMVEAESKGLTVFPYKKEYIEKKLQQFMEEVK